MRKTSVLITLLVLSAAAFGNGISINSPGTRALSMAGAYIAIADDYSAPYWNPAGLWQIERAQGSIFLTDVIPIASYEYYPGPQKAEGIVNHYILPNAAFIWPCMLTKKMRMAVSFLVPAGLGTEWDGEELLGLNGPPTYSSAPNLFGSDAFTWESKLSVFNISLSTSYRVDERLSLGAAFHLVRGSMTMKRGVSTVNNYNPMGAGDLGYLDSQYEEESDGWGYGFGFGVQYQLSDAIRFGAMMRTPMKVQFSGDATVTNQTLSDLTGGAVSATMADFEFDRDMTMPLRIGAGFCWQPVERFLFATDLLWTNWSKYEDYLISTHDSETDTLTLLWDDALQVRFGGEYWLYDNFALRGGIYYDPAPGPDKTQTILIPNATFMGYTCGAGYRWNNLSFDFAVEWLNGKERDIDDADVIPGVGMAGKHNVDILALSLAATYKF